MKNIVYQRVPNKELMYTIQIQTTCNKIIENQQFKTCTFEFSET